MVKRWFSRVARKLSRKSPSRPEPPPSPGPWTVADFDVPPREGEVRFHDLSLPAEIMHGVADLGFRYCTPIQAKVLLPARAGHNVAGRAQTGTGKTAAFLIAAFSRFLEHPLPDDRPAAKPRALVLAPTRELVIQIVKDAVEIGRHCPFRSMAVYGGMDLERQRRDLGAGPLDLVAATPGRLLDFLRRRAIDLSGVEMLVIDEADRMLDMGFIPDVRRIIRAVPPKERRCTMLFSATLSDDVRRLAGQWMPDPVEVTVDPDQVAAENVRPIVYLVASHQKFALLYNLLKQQHLTRVLVFANRRDTAQGLVERLASHGVACELLSGAVAQNRRLHILEGFRDGRIDVVVATDVAARGLHVEDISHVINFELPYEPEDYVHRIGRTGRAGAEGTAISFACEDESFILPEIEAYIGGELACVHPDEQMLARPSRPAGRGDERRRTSHGTSGERRGGSGHRRPGGRRRPPRRGRR